MERREKANLDLREEAMVAVGVEEPLHGFVGSGVGVGQWTGGATDGGPSAGVVGAAVSHSPARHSAQSLTHLPLCLWLCFIIFSSLCVFFVFVFVFVFWGNIIYKLIFSLVDYEKS